MQTTLRRRSFTAPHRLISTFVRVLAVAMVAIGSFASTDARAIGVQAGTQIQNQATATYDVGGTPFVATSGSNIVTVDEIVDVQVTLQSPPVPVASPDTNQVLSFLVTNTGNGTESFEIVVNNGVGGDQFDPIFASIWLDDGDGLFNPTLDTPYVLNSNDPVLDANDPANDSALLFVVNDIPGSRIDGDVGLSRLTVTSVALGAQTPGFTSNGTGDAGTDAVAGTSGGQAQVDGSYVVAAVSVSLTKTATVVPHATFGTQPVPGAIVRYEITVTVTGAGTAQNLVITDPIPVGTIYENASMELNAVGLSDAVDLDEGDFDSTLANGIAVDLGDVPGGSPDNVIHFNVMIDPN